MLLMKTIEDYSLEAMRDMTRDLTKKNHDVEYSPKDLAFAGDSRISTPDGDLVATDEALYQMAYRANIPRRAWDWVWAHEPDNALDIFNRAWGRYAEGREKSKVDGKLLVRGRDMGGQTYVRAVLTDRYGICDNDQFLDTLLDLLPCEMGAAKFKGIKQRFYLEPLSGRMSCKLIIPGTIPGTEGDRHDLGLHAGNSETGGGSLFAASAFQRFSCTNQFSVLGKKARVFHNKSGEKSQEDYRLDLHRKLREALGKNSEVFQKYWNTRDTRVDNPAEVLTRLGRECGLTAADCRDSMLGDRLARHVAEMGSTAFAVVNNLTEWAQTLETAEQRLLVESVAGQMSQLAARRWS